MDMNNIDKLVILRNKLLLLQADRKNNRLDYMKWELYPEQNKMRLMILNRLEERTGPNIFVVFGGNRSGKSELGGGVVAEAFSNLKNGRIWCATFSDLSVKVQQRKLASLIRDRDIAYGSYNEVRGWKNKTIIAKNKTVLYFKSYEQGAESFQGDDIDIAWFDEEPPYSIFQETLIRLGDRSGVMVITFTSLQGFTKLVNRLWESDDKNVKTTILTPYKNPFLSEQVKEQLRQNIDSDDLQSRWEGKPHLKEGLIYKEYNNDHKIRRFDYKEMVANNPHRYQIHEGIDPHDRTPHHWLRFLYDRVEDIVYIVEELKAPYECMLIADFARLIKLKRGNRNRTNKPSLPDFVQIDTSSQKPTPIFKAEGEDQVENYTIRNEFARNGIETILVVKDNSIGITAVKERLKIVRTPVGEIKRRARLYVFADLSGVHWEFMRYSWDSYLSATVTERKEIVNSPKKKDDHFMDIIKYECIKLKGDIDNKEEKNYYKPIYSSMGY